MLSPVVGEFMGTMVLVLLGNGVIADVALARSKAEGGGWIVVSAGWAFAAMAGIFTALACGSLHIHNDVLPALRGKGVSEQQLQAMLVENPRRIFDQQNAY